jgi:predicted transposase/invertase (TIGR01784 family)
MKQRKTGELVSFDYAIKRLLRNKENYEIPEGFLSELLSEDISVKSIGESESNRESPAGRYNKADILAENESGERLLIEMQFIKQIDFLERLHYGTGTTITERLAQRAEYRDVRKVYSINILYYFDLGEGDDYVYHGKTHFTGLHKNDELLFSSAQRKVFEEKTAGDVYPEYYILKMNNFDGQVKDSLDAWIYFLKNNAFRDKAKGLDRASEVLNLDNLTPEERKEYEYILDIRSDNLSYYASARDTGREEGREESRIECEKLTEELEKEREKLEKLEKERADLLAEITRLKQK